MSHLVGIARELAELSGEVPRLFVVTRNAASVHTDDLANLAQAGLRGLMRVIDSEHPHLRSTQMQTIARDPFDRCRSTSFAELSYAAVH